LALTDTGDAAEAEALERAGDRLALRIEDAGLEGDGDAGAHGRSSWLVVPGCLLDQTRARGERVVGFHKNTEALGNFAIGIDQAAEILTEAVLVELVARLDVPEAAVVRGNLVGQHDPHGLALIEAAALDLEVDE